MAHLRRLFGNERGEGLFEMFYARSGGYAFCEAFVSHDLHITISSCQGMEYSRRNPDTPSVLDFKHCLKEEIL